MSWQSPPETVTLLESALGDLSCEKRRMFGCPVYFAGGALFAGVHGGRVFLRLAEGDRQAFAAEHPDAVPFEPLAGRRMREYLVVPEALALEAAPLSRWLARAHRYAASLPPKAPRSRSGRRRP